LKRVQNAKTIFPSLKARGREVTITFNYTHPIVHYFEQFIISGMRSNAKTKIPSLKARGR